MRRKASLVLALAACGEARLETVERVPCGATGGELARPAAAFLETIGFNLVLDQLSPGPDLVARFDRLAELGVRRIRTGAWAITKADPGVLAEVGRRGWPMLAQLSIETDIPAFLRDHGGRIEALQVASPANDIVPSYPVTRLPGQAAQARTILDALPATTRPKLVGPIIFQTQDALDVGDLSPWIDYGGLRSTIGLVEPSRSFGDWTDMAFAVSGGKPLLAAKASWPATGDTTSTMAISETRQARYVTRLLLESWNRGIVATHYDQLMDHGCTDVAGCFAGLIRADGTPKPAFSWWKTMVAAIASRPTTIASRRLPFSIAAATSPEEVHHTLLENADGSVWLVLWLEVRGGDAPVTRPVTLDVGLPLLSASLLDLRTGATTPGAVGAKGPLALTVSDAPLLLRLEPACF